VQADLKACAGAESGGGGCESAGAKRGGEIGEGQEGQVRQAMPEEGGEGVFRSKPGGDGCGLLGRFPDLPLDELGLFGNPICVGWVFTLVVISVKQLLYSQGFLLFFTI
jgi:hypothetical protein